jgi:hypothetical protein
MNFDYRTLDIWFFFFFININHSDLKYLIINYVNNILKTFHVSKYFKKCRAIYRHLKFRFFPNFNRLWFDNTDGHNILI